LVAKAPLGKIITETDSPYLTPDPHRGSRNEPGYVIIVGNSIAEIKNISFAAVEKATTENCKTVFKL
jgi:TatD DNase family protein